LCDQRTSYTFNPQALNPYQAGVTTLSYLQFTTGTGANNRASFYFWFHWDGATQTTFTGANQYARVFESARSGSAYAIAFALGTSASSQLMGYCGKGNNIVSANLGITYSSIGAQWLYAGCGFQNSGGFSAIVTTHINGTTTGPTTACCTTDAICTLTTCSQQPFATMRLGDATVSGTGVATPAGQTLRMFSQAIRGFHIMSGTTLTAGNFVQMLNGGAKVGSDLVAFSMDEGTGLPVNTGSATPTITDSGTANDPDWLPHPGDPRGHVA
jgi:hypothetical protein